MDNINTETIYLYGGILTAARELLGNSQYEPYKIELGNEHFFIILFENLLNNEIIPFFVNKREVSEILSHKRKARAADIFVHPLPQKGQYTATNTAKETTYKLTPYPDKITCECKDYQAQSYYFGDYQKISCKHILALLRDMDYYSISAYLKDDWNYQEAYSSYLNKQMILQDDRAFYLA